MRSLLLAVAIVLAAVSCSKKGTVLEGTWMETCQVDGTDSFQWLYEFKGNEFRAFERLFDSSTTCGGEARGGEVVTGTFVIGAEDSRSGAPKGAKLINYTVGTAVTYEIFVLSDDGKQVQFSATAGTRAEDRPTTVDGIWFNLVDKSSNL